MNCSQITSVILCFLCWRQCNRLAWEQVPSCLNFPLILAAFPHKRQNRPHIRWLQRSFNCLIFIFWPFQGYCLYLLCVLPFGSHDKIHELDVLKLVWDEEDHEKMWRIGLKRHPRQMLRSYLAAFLRQTLPAFLKSDRKQIFILKPGSWHVTVGDWAQI